MTTRQKVIIELEVDVEDDPTHDTDGDAAYVVGEILDAGSLQDDINEHCYDAATMKVISAVVK